MEEKIKDRAVLCGLSCESFSEDKAVSEESLDELSELLMTAGGEEIARFIQKRGAPEPKTLIGTGKALELAEFIKNNEINLAVFDNELSPAQTKNLEDILDVRVIDRSTLILDIFASRALSREGKLQVELAQYKYLLPRLSGKGIALSRLGGGIGTRGPGETKLETARRHIRRRISRLEEELSGVMQVRNEQRRRRTKSEIPLVALVGYTNAGKSTLLNTLTGADIHAENRLFDTLDPTSRRFNLNETTEGILSDTVGFIRKLPHHLTKAFRATLEELLYADLLVHVVDASNPQAEAHIRVVDGVISDLGAEKIPRVIAFNKCDVAEGLSDIALGEGCVKISAKTGEGLSSLLEEICRTLSLSERKVELTIPFNKSHLLDLLHREGKVLSLEYTENGAEVVAMCNDKLFGKIKAETEV